MKYNTIYFFLLSIVIFSCHKDDDWRYALIQTGDITDIDDTGATFNAWISETGGSEILDYGFVWNTKPAPILDVSEKLVIPGSPSIGVLSERISSTLSAGKEYYVRAYIRSKDYITYGKTVKFYSLGSLVCAPVIDDFFPKIGNLYDTLLIKGENFRYKLSDNKVIIGDQLAKIIYSVKDTLKVLVPSKLNKPASLIQVGTPGSTITSLDTFYLIPPVVCELGTKTGTFGSRLIVYGKNFSSSPGTLRVFFDTHLSEIIDACDTSLNVTVPISLGKRQCKVFVEMNNLKVSSTDTFTLESFTISDFTPMVVQTGNAITITGNNFSPLNENNIISIGGLKASASYSTLTELKVYVPLQDQGVYTGRDVTVIVNVLGESNTFNETLLLNDQWFRFPNVPFSSVYRPNCFVVNSKVYVLNANSAEFKCFDPETRQWTLLNGFPGTKRKDGAGFHLNGNIYFGTGSNGRVSFDDFYQYNISTNSWTKKTSFIGSKRTGASGFSLNGKGYLTSGVKPNADPISDCWEYIPESDTWIEVDSYEDPGIAYGTITELEGCVIYGIGWSKLVGDYSQRVYKFDPSSEIKWQRVANFPLSRGNYPAISFVLDGMPYYKTVNSGFYKYNIASDKWINIETHILTDIKDGTGFSVSGKAYAGIGPTKTIWEYDPYR